ncbi:hypothetical protein Bbelb_154510 [Branchiostoma belcheri]|nr:hypothetical protein Bbelb_154510 [Branchiostoma belcheri]
MVIHPGTSSYGDRRRSGLYGLRVTTGGHTDISLHWGRRLKTLRPRKAEATSQQPSARYESDWLSYQTVAITGTAHGCLIEDINTFTSAKRHDSARALLTPGPLGEEFITVQDLDRRVPHVTLHCD